MPFESRLETLSPATGLIGGKHVVEGAIFADDDDHVFDGSCGGSVLSGGWKG